MDATKTPEGIARLMAAGECMDPERDGSRCCSCESCTHEAPLCDSCGHGLAEHSVGALGCVCVDCALTWARSAPEEREETANRSAA